MTDGENLEYKIKINPDTKEIDDLEKRLEEFEKSGKEVRARLNVGEGGGGAGDKLSTNLDTFISKLSKLVDKIGKKDEDKKQEEQKKESSTEDFQKMLAKQISLMPSALSSTKNFLGFAGSAVGSLAGPVGTVIGGIVGDLVGKGLDKAQQGFMDVLHENLKLRVLSEQTGKTTDALYRLKTQADLVGFSLEGIIKTNASLADEIVGGLSIEKAQLLMSSGINVKDLYEKNGGDIEKINQTIFSKVDQALQEYPAAIRAAQLRRFGFSDEEQTARRHMFESGVLDKTREVMDFATTGGKVPITPAYEVQAQATRFLGAQAEIEGALRSLFSTQQYAMKVSSSLVEIQAGVVNMVNKTLNQGETYSKEAYDLFKLPETKLKQTDRGYIDPTRMSGYAAGMVDMYTHGTEQRYRLQGEAQNKVATPR